MRLQELKELSSEELKTKVETIKRELLDLRILASGGKLDKPHRIGQAKKEVAQMLTILRSRRDGEGKAQDLKKNPVFKKVSAKSNA